jgi:hypothetical protein
MLNPLGAKAKFVGRWIALGPAAALAAFVTPALVKYVGQFSPYPDPGSALGRVAIEGAAGAVAGAMFVYVGTRIAPSHRQMVARVLSVIGMVIATAAALGDLIAGYYWLAWQGVCAALGAYAAAQQISPEVEHGQIGLAPGSDPPTPSEARPREMNPSEVRANEPRRDPNDAAEQRILLAGALAEAEFLEKKALEPDLPPDRQVARSPTATWRAARGRRQSSAGRRSTG